jgi:hypothetical protein
MKSIFNQLKGKCPDELIKVVWSHNTTASRSTGFTPFKLLFGDVAITPKETRMGSIRTVASTEDEADCQVTKDTIEGTRLQTIEHINKYQAETIKWRDKKVRLKNIKPGHLVLRRIDNPDTVGKLQLNGKAFFGGIFVKARFLQTEGHGQQQHTQVLECGLASAILCVIDVIFLFFPMAPFSFQEGRKVFNGAIGCNFHFFLFSPMQYKGQIPPRM